MQFETTELKLLKRLYAYKPPKGVYAHIIKRVINSNNKYIHRLQIFEIYEQCKTNSIVAHIEWGEALIREVIEYVEANTDIYVKKNILKHLSDNDLNNY